MASTTESRASASELLRLLAGYASHIYQLINLRLIKKDCKLVDVT
jgi:hypothetical protein